MAIVWASAVSTVKAWHILVCKAEYWLWLRHICIHLRSVLRPADMPLDFIVMRRSTCSKCQVTRDRAAADVVADRLAQSLWELFPWWSLSTAVIVPRVSAA